MTGTNLSTTTNRPLTPSITAPALDNADMEMVNMIQNIVQRNNRELRKDIDSMNPLNDAWMIAMVILGIAAYMVKNFVMPFVDKRKNGNGKVCDMKDAVRKLEEISNKLDGLNAPKANEAHGIVCTKDSDGLPVLLSIPRHMRRSNELMDHIVETLKNIDSHFHK